MLHSQDYIRSVVNVVTSHLGWRVCVLNWRGFNKAPISKKKVFRPDDIGDMQLAIESANKKHPAGPLFAGPPDPRTPTPACATILTPSRLPRSRVQCRVEPASQISWQPREASPCGSRGVCVQWL